MKPTLLTLLAFTLLTSTPVSAGNSDQSFLFACYREEGGILGFPICDAEGQELRGLLFEVSVPEPDSWQWNLKAMDIHVRLSPITDELFRTISLPIQNRAELPNWDDYLIYDSTQDRWVGLRLQAGQASIETGECEQKTIETTLLATGVPDGKPLFTFGVSVPYSIAYENGIFHSPTLRFLPYKQTFEIWIFDLTAENGVQTKLVCKDYR